ncbi:hypothetical protein G3545_10590 [Starkeya sp. ORNL1]|uniref:hypothetical protein n=1 Tax=Starkeya sp. ORNL1 TaxID=2709380 RepID=UPI0014634344|nr:hypothetical protein [Starkeya sp. ORNL1]QJP14055.1 hypothetical protein G3545_10590 [Starkeya sp. ORNL1]
MLDSAARRCVTGSHPIRHARQNEEADAGAIDIAPLSLCLQEFEHAFVVGACDDRAIGRIGDVEGAATT